MVCPPPFISILVPARNEATTIEDCLKHLVQLNYPKNRLEILIGNDHSEDNTQDVVFNFIHQNPDYQNFIKLISIPENQKKVEGKAGVLAILAHKAQGEFFFMTDADTCVPQNWIQEMLQNFEEKTGIVTGFTLVETNSFFANLQALDWLIGLGIIQQFAQWNIPLTSLGNNMAVRKSAYEATGGYENFPFSVTEDFALFQEIIQQGFKFRHLITIDSLAITQAEKTFYDLLQQRQRWAWGAVQIPFYWLPILMTYLLFGLILGFLFWWNWKIALTSWLLKMTLHYGLASIFMYRLQRFSFWKYVFFYEMYHLIFHLILAGFFLFAQKVIWKGKSYVK